MPSDSRKSASLPLGPDPNPRGLPNKLRSCNNKAGRRSPWFRSPCLCLTRRKGDTGYADLRWQALGLSLKKQQDLRTCVEIKHSRDLFSFDFSKSASLPCSIANPRDLRKEARLSCFPLRGASPETPPRLGPAAARLVAARRNVAADWHGASGILHLAANLASNWAKSMSELPRSRLCALVANRMAERAPLRGLRIASRGDACSLAVRAAARVA